MPAVLEGSALCQSNAITQPHLARRTGVRVAVSCSLSAAQPAAVWTFLRLTF